MASYSPSSLSHILGPSCPTSNSVPSQPHSFHPPPPLPDSFIATPASGPYGAVPTSTSATLSNPGTVPLSSAQPQPPTSPSTPSNQGHAGPSLYACGDCGRRYSRPEHLQRHVQTHTLGRRFACTVCGKTFARADLKKRHEANHGNDPSKKRRRTTSSPTAGRVTHACKACAVARVKCQEDKPCQRCARRGLECVSSEANSAAAMHLMHLSGSAPSATPSVEGNDEPSPPSAQPTWRRGDTDVRAHQAAQRPSASEQTPLLDPNPVHLGTPDNVGENSSPLKPQYRCSRIANVR